MTTSPPAPVPHDGPAATAAPSPVAAVFRVALRDMLLLLGVLTVLGLGLGALLAGRPGVWGALIGVALALVFSGTTIGSMLATARSAPTTFAAVVMGAWLAKVIVIIVVLALIQDRDFYHRGVLAVVLMAGVIGSAVLDLRAVNRGHVPYVDPRDQGPDKRQDPARP